MMKPLLRKVLPQSILLKLKNIVGSFDDKIYPFFSKSSFLSSLYYCFFSTQFRREHQSVLSGRIAYRESLRFIEQSSALLRRNTHRLEKGLIMEPRRLSFAETYINETVELFAKCLSVEVFSQQELKWALDVLSKYFDVVADTPIIAKARDRFSCLPIDCYFKEELGLKSPYESHQRINSGISRTQLFDLFKQRRSVRWFKDQKVRLSVIAEAINMASQAPSACNRQPFEFYTCIEPNVAAEIASIPMGTKGFSQNVQALIVVMGDLSAYPLERDRHVIYVDGGLVTMQLMLAFESLGLSTCPINWPDIELYEVKLAQRLNLPLHKRPIMMMAVGYAKSSGGIPYSQKKSASQLIKVVE